MMFKCRLLPFAVAGALASLSGTALSIPLTSAVYGTTASPQDGIFLGGVQQAVVASSDLSENGIPGSVDVIPSKDDGISGNNMFFHSYGGVSAGNTYMGSRASGNGNYDGTGAFFLRQPFAVPAGGPQSYDFNFVVQGGELALYCSDCTGGGSATFTIDIRIDRDGTGPLGDEALGSMTGSLAVDSAGVTTFTHAESGMAALPFSDSGDMNPTSGQARSISWSDTAYALSLGTFAGGSSFLLSYDMITRATGAFAPGTNCVDFGGGGYGEEFATFAVNEGSFYCSDLGNTIARSGDPGGLQTTGGAGIRSVGVPEPGTIALLGLGLAGAFATTQRRRRKQ